MDVMRALTLKPHWAHAVAHLGKRIENRSKPIPKALIGQRVAIHAGAELPKHWTHELFKAAPKEPRAGSPVVMRAPPKRRTGIDAACLAGCGHDRDGHRVVVTRAIVATAVLARCVLARPGTRHPLGWSDPYAAWWWILEDVRTLAEPVPVERGQLGLWRLSDDVVAQIGGVS